MSHDDDPDPVDRDDLDGALRFVHALGMQSREDLIHAGARVDALVHVLAEAGVVRREVVDAAARQLAEARIARERAEGVVVRIADIEDKYALDDLPDVDCDALMPLCQGRCCALLFHLSFQDLDEGEVRWDYERPYQIRHEADGRCTHQLGSGGCGVYAHRPGTCRVYDCRQDPRIWIDFERRIPAPLPEHVVPLDRLRQPGPDRALRRARRGEPAS